MVQFERREVRIKHLPHITMLFAIVNVVTNEGTFKETHTICIRSFTA